MARHPFHRSRPRALRAALVALALLTPAAVVTATAPGPVHADEAGPAIKLSARKTVTTYQQFEGRIFSNFGLSFRVSGAPLEIWTQRPSYDAGIVTTLKLASGDVTLPAGITDRIGTLTDIVKLSFVRQGADGTPDEEAERFVRHLDGCLGGSAERVHPEGVFTSPYPEGCYYNPLAIGGVQGIPAGWKGTIVDRWGGNGVRVRPGSYEVTARIAPRYADALGLPASERVETIDLVVKKRRDGDDCRGCRPSRATGDRDTTPPTPEATEPRGAGVDSIDDLPEGTPVPDLRALPAFGIQLNKAGTQLRFAANVWNNGTSDLVVDGFRRSGEDVMDAYQYFLDDDGDVVDYRSVGTMEWDPDPTHEHWHFTDFATYRLLKADQTRAVRSGKEAFCLANTDPVDLTAPGANWRVRYDDLGSVCGGERAQSLREVLAAGWGDTYAQYRAGQAFPVKNVPDGVYYIQVLANPDLNLIEASTDNNQALRKVRLFTNAKGVRKVKVFPVGVVEESHLYR